jgi:hypothetical protein
MTNTQAVTFVIWLTDLLSERRQLCALLQERRRAKLIADLKAATAAEDAIRELVLGGLHLSKADSPNPALFVDAIAAMLFRSPLAESSDFWSSLTPGITLHYVPALKARMLDLCGDLDSVIARKRYQDEEESAAIQVEQEGSVMIRQEERLLGHSLLRCDGMQVP